MGKLREHSDALPELVKEEQQYVEALYDRMLLDKDLSEGEVLDEIEDLKKCGTDLKQARDVVSDLQDELQARWHDVNKSKRKRFSAPSNAQIDYNEETSDFFAKGMNWYKIVLLFAVGSLVGVIVESLWCLLTRGYLESRAGLVYGPFNPLYGIGAVVMSLALYRYRNRSAWLSFIGGMVTGGVVEYVCSYFQELVFGSRSWDYSWMPFNINGRVCLAYCIFWGFLGAIWMKKLYPRIAKWLMRIPRRAGKLVTWIVIVYFTFDCVMSVAAVYRWSQRLEGKPADNAVEVFFDEHFPDERMETVYANMKFGDERIFKESPFKK